MSDWTDRVDRAISAFFPGWAARRALSRAQLSQIEQLGSFRGARRTRIRGRQEPRQGTADWFAEAGHERRWLVDRARQAERDNVLADGLLSRSVENVVGCGFRYQAQTNNDRWNDRAEKLWQEWGELGADVRGLSSWDEMLGLTFRSLLRDGDTGTLMLNSGQLQALESDQINSPRGMTLGPNHVDGIDLDDRGRPVSFYVVDRHNPILGASIRQLPSSKIPADQVIFLANRQRLNQTRGLTKFKGIFWLLDQIDGNIEAVTTASRMAALFGMVLTRKTRMQGLETTDDTWDGEERRKLVLEPGSFLELEPGEEAKQIDPRHPTTNWPDFLATLGRMVGLAFGLPLEITFMDFSRTNYSSARAALLQAYNVWLCHQATLKRYSTRVLHWKLISWMEQGLLPVRSDALDHRWICPGWRWVDPEKEIKAALAEVDMGVATLSEVAMRAGKDFSELVAARKVELEQIREAGMPDVRSTLTRDPGAGLPAEEEPPADDGDESDRARG